MVPDSRRGSTATIESNSDPTTTNIADSTAGEFHPMSTWNGEWFSGYPGITGTMTIPMYDNHSLDYTTFCDTTYTGWFKSGSSFRVDIEVTGVQQQSQMVDSTEIVGGGNGGSSRSLTNVNFPTLTAQNGKQTITYLVEQVFDDGNAIKGKYISKDPSDKGTFQMRRG